MLKRCVAALFVALGLSLVGVGTAAAAPPEMLYNAPSEMTHNTAPEMTHNTAPEMTYN